MTIFLTPFNNTRFILRLPVYHSRNNKNQKVNNTGLDYRVQTLTSDFKRFVNYQQSLWDLTRCWRRWPARYTRRKSFQSARKSARNARPLGWPYRRNSIYSQCTLEGLTPSVSRWMSTKWLELSNSRSTSWRLTMNEIPINSCII